MNTKIMLIAALLIGGYFWLEGDTLDRFESKLRGVKGADIFSSPRGRSTEGDGYRRMPGAGISIANEFADPPRDER